MINELPCRPFSPGFRSAWAGALEWAGHGLANVAVLVWMLVVALHLRSVAQVP
jgi:hypothetical protein